jgi:hypothetical protein
MAVVVSCSSRLNDAIEFPALYADGRHKKTGHKVTLSVLLS